MVKTNLIKTAFLMLTTVSYVGVSLANQMPDEAIVNNVEYVIIYEGKQINTPIAKTGVVSSIIREDTMQSSSVSNNILAIQKQNKVHSHLWKVEVLLLNGKKEIHEFTTFPKFSIGDRVKIKENRLTIVRD